MDLTDIYCLYYELMIGMISRLLTEFPGLLFLIVSGSLKRCYDAQYEPPFI